MTLRDVKKRQRKPTSEILKSRGRTCVAPGCDNPITPFKGPGEKDHCSHHQKNLHDFGGLAKIGRAHSHNRVDCCDECGYKPGSDPQIAIYKDSDPVLFNRLVRSNLEVDHIGRRNIENADHPENCRTLCLKCHRIKTILNEDYLPNS